MTLVKLIDLFVSVLFFLFKGERNRHPSIPLALGSIGTAGLLLVMIVSLGVPRLSYQLNTTDYSAALANASGLSGGDPVYVAGVPAGRVEGIRLAVDHVLVDFRLDERQPLGNQTTATVRLRTVLGKRFLDVMPAGAFDPTDPRVIPLGRTTVPYSLDDVGRQASRSADGVDRELLTQMLATVSDSIPGDNGTLSATLTGVSAASAAMARSGDRIDELLRVSRTLSDLLVEQSDSLAGTAAYAQRIVSALVARREALTAIVENTKVVLSQLSTVYSAKRDDFATMVQSLTRVSDTLRANAATIERLLTTMPPAVRAVVNATGNGTWADVNSPSLVLPDNLLCALNVQRECR